MTYDPCKFTMTFLIFYWVQTVSLQFIIEILHQIKIRREGEKKKERKRLCNVHTYLHKSCNKTFKTIIASNKSPVHTVPPQTIKWWNNLRPDPQKGSYLK